MGWHGLSHYIDDFITVGAPGTGECGRNLGILKETCEWWGLPLDKEKEDGPATAITFLGIEVNTLAGELRQPASKLAELVSLVKRWRGMKLCRKRELLSIIDSLSHACKVVRAGRSFLRRFIDLAATVKYLDRRVRLNRAARVDVEWWWQFGTRWNGVALMVAADARVPAHVMVSDASGGLGCGAEWDGRCFHIQWQGLGKTQGFSIMAKELLPIVVAVAIWGPCWVGNLVRANATTFRWCPRSTQVHAGNQMQCI